MNGLPYDWGAWHLFCDSRQTGVRLVLVSRTTQKKILQGFVTNIPVGICSRQVLRDFWTGVSFEKFAEIAERLVLPVVDTDVCLYRSMGAPHVPVEDDDRFWVIVWSSPRIDFRRSIRAPDSLLGLPVETTSEGFAPSGKGVEFCDPATGYCFAELVGRRLYILFPIGHEGKSTEIDIFSAILARVVQYLLEYSPPEYVEGGATGGVLSSDDSSIADALLWSPRLRIEQLRDSIGRFTDEAESLKLTLGLLGQTADTAAMQLSQEQEVFNQLASSDEVRAESREIFEMIRSLPQVRLLPMYDGTNLSFFTKRVTCIHRNTKCRHELGYYRMSIPTLKAGSFRWFNLSRLVNGLYRDMHHPHVYEQGAGCQGTLTARLQRALDEGDIFSVVQMGLQFLRTVNVRDTAGSKLGNWPKIDP